MKKNEDGFYFSLDKNEFIKWNNIIYYFIFLLLLTLGISLTYYGITEESFFYLQIIGYIILSICYF